MYRALPLAFLAALAACDNATPAPSPTPAASASSDAAARVAALPAAQRDGVLFRAIRDAGHQGCQQVTGSERAGTTAPATWLATCDDGARWLVTIGADGTATVTGARK